MKKLDKKKYEEVPEEVVKSARKKVDRPWDLEYMIIDEKCMNDHSFYTNTVKVGEWKKYDWFSKGLSVKHVLEQMNKIGRTTRPWVRGTNSIENHWRFAGKKFRIVNRDTKEIVSLLSNGKEYYAEPDERTDSE